MRTWTRAAAVLLAAALAGCGQPGGEGEGGGSSRSGRSAAETRADSLRKEQQALIDSGVTVDTQVIDTGVTRPAPAEGN